MNIYKNSFIFIVLGLLLTLPFLLHKAEPKASQRDSENSIIIITPHNESVRYEFETGFKAWYLEKYGQSIYVDWRVIGGSQEIVRYLNTLYVSAFRLYWTKTLGKPWFAHLKDAFKDPKIAIPKSKLSGTIEQQARQVFLETPISCGIDILFGGGEVEANEQAAKGFFVASEIEKLHPDWFSEQVIPKTLGGLPLRDPQGLWFGAAHSGFGIIFNRDVLGHLGIDHAPSSWEDLADPRYFGEVALADPMISASSNRIFDMIIQQCMLSYQKTHPKADTPSILEAGWNTGLQLIQRMSANTRYFTDFSTQPVLDVSAGVCAVGAAIDFFGLSQEENLRTRGDSARFGFAIPKGGSVPTADIVAMLRGAPNPKAALAFIEYVLSIEGQKLWDFKVGAPSGPLLHALRRPPIRKDLYTPDMNVHRINPEYNPYLYIQDFAYNPTWTSPLFSTLRFVIRAAFVDPHKELASAWKAINQALNGNEKEVNYGQLALKHLQNIDRINYKEARESISKALEDKDPLSILRLQSEITETFKKQYIQAKMIATSGQSKYL